jgi:hypothetical protein
MTTKTSKKTAKLSPQQRAWQTRRRLQKEAEKAQAARKTKRAAKAAPVAA